LTLLFKVDFSKHVTVKWYQKHLCDLHTAKKSGGKMFVFELVGLQTVSITFFSIDTFRGIYVSYTCDAALNWKFHDNNTERLN